MALFRYEAVDNQGRKINGHMPANDEANLEAKLQSINYWLIDASVERARSTEEKAKGKNSWLSFGGGHRRELIQFCTLMKFQTEVGISLVQSLEVASFDCESPEFRNVLKGMQQQLESGRQFYEAVEKYPAYFSPMFVNLVRAGELSSKLPEVLDDLRKYLEWVDQIVADVRQASLYPLIILCVVVVFALFLFSYIIPQFAALLTSLKVPLPLLTLVIFGLGTFVKATWLIWLPIFILVPAGVFIGRRVSKEFALAFDRFKLSLPIFGVLNKMLAISRFTHNLAILYRSGIAIIQSLNLCQGLVGSPVVESAIAEVEKDVKAGKQLSEAMRRHPIFPALLLRMVVIGETTGNLDESLENVANYYNLIIPRRIKKLFTVLEPMMMLGLIIAVGCIAVAIYLPILSLMGSIGR